MATHTITKATLANTLFDQLGLNKREAKEFVELFFDLVKPKTYMADYSPAQ